MDTTEFASQLLLGQALNQKLLSVPDDLVIEQSKVYSRQEKKIQRPSRDKKLDFSDKKVSFPKKGNFHKKDVRALALHFFANHELLAIEMMAKALLIIPMENDIQKKILSTISDEQRHLSSYVERMGQLGCEFGDYPLNDFFWKLMGKVTTLENYFSLLSLTFESANLDFAKYYKDLFKEVEDIETAHLMEKVYEDEIHHVAFGATMLQKICPANKDLWHFYLEHLPENITPARSKGVIFDEEARKRAGLNDDFIDQPKSFRDPKNALNRRLVR